MSVLALNKTTMHNFHYTHIQSKYQPSQSSRIQTLCYLINMEDKHKNMVETLDTRECSPNYFPYIDMSGKDIGENEQ